jgi:hypothetical protein
MTCSVATTKKKVTDDGQRLMATRDSKTSPTMQIALFWSFLQDLSAEKTRTQSGPLGDTEERGTPAWATADCVTGSAGVATLHRELSAVRVRKLCSTAVFGETLRGEVDFFKQMTQEEEEIQMCKFVPWHLILPVLAARVD